MIMADTDKRDNELSIEAMIINTHIARPVMAIILTTAHLVMAIMHTMAECTGIVMTDLMIDIMGLMIGTMLLEAEIDHVMLLEAEIDHMTVIESEIDHMTVIESEIDHMMVIEAEMEVQVDHMTGLGIALMLIAMIDHKISVAEHEAGHMTGMIDPLIGMPPTIDHLLHTGGSRHVCVKELVLAIVTTILLDHLVMFLQQQILTAIYVKKITHLVNTQVCSVLTAPNMGMWLRIVPII